MPLCCKHFERCVGYHITSDRSLIFVMCCAPDDFRVFVGDLGHEVNDDMLFRAFVGFPSLQKARVIRDKITKKSRGYGFVSFRDGQDYLRAMREMNGMLCFRSCSCSSTLLVLVRVRVL